MALQPAPWNDRTHLETVVPILASLEAFGVSTQLTRRGTRKGAEDARAFDLRHRTSLHPFVELKLLITLLIACYRFELYGLALTASPH
jgi:hypothetical protein